MAVVGAAVFHLAAKATDDIFITYRYAKNLSEGAGFVFNPGERVFAASDPAVALFLGGAHWCTGTPIPLLGTLLTAISLLALASLILVDAARRDRALEGVIGGSLLVASPVLWLGQGAGPLIALTLLAASAFVAERRPVLAGLVAGLAVWCRPDAALGCAVLAAMLALKSWRASLRFSLSAGGPVLCGLIAARIYFGTFLPVTLAVKRKLAVVGHLSPTVGSFWVKAMDLFQNVQGSVAWTLVVLGFLGAFVLLFRGDFFGRFLVAYAAALAIAYSLFRLPFFVWYIAPVAVVLYVGVGCFVQALIRSLAGIPDLRARTAARAVASLAGALVVAIALRANAQWVWAGGAQDWRMFAYKAAGEWLAANAPIDSDLATDEVGIVGYYSGRRIVDLEGLVTPASVPFAAAGDQLGAFLANPTRFVMFHDFSKRGGTAPIVGRPWFASAFKPATTLRQTDGSGSVTLYERIPGTQLPEKRAPRVRPPTPSE